MSIGLDGPDWPTLPGEPLLSTSDPAPVPPSITEEEAREAAEVLVEIGPPEPFTDAEVAEVLMEKWHPNEPSGRFTEEEAQALLDHWEDPPPD